MDTGVTASLKDRSGIKRPKSMDSVINVPKKPKMKLKATEAIRSLVNIIRSKDRRKSSPTDEPHIGPFLQDGINNNAVRTLSSFLARNPFENLLSCGGSNKDSLSQSWSYYGNDPLNEFSKYENCANNEESHESADVFSEESYTEDDYWHDYLENLDEDVVHTGKPASGGIKMGVSIVQTLNTARLHEPKTPCRNLRRKSNTIKSSRQRHASLPNFAANPVLSSPTTNEKDIVGEVRTEGTDINNRPMSSYPLSPVTDVNNRPMSSYPLSPVTDINSRSMSSYPLSPVTDINNRSMSSYPLSSVTDINSRPMSSYPLSSVTDINSRPMSSYPLSPVTDINNRSMSSYPLSPVTDINNRPMSSYPLSPVTDINNGPMSSYPLSPVTDINNRSMSSYPLSSVTDINSRPMSSYPLSSVTDINSRPMSSYPLSPVTDINNRSMSSYPLSPVTDINNRPMSSYPLSPVTDINNGPMSSYPLSPVTDVNNRLISSYPHSPVTAVDGGLDENDFCSEPFVRMKHSALFPIEDIRETTSVESKYHPRNKALQFVNKPNTAQTEVCTRNLIAAELLCHCHEGTNKQLCLLKSGSFNKPNFEAVRKDAFSNFFDGQSSNTSNLLQGETSDDAVVPNCKIQSQLPGSKQDASLFEKGGKSCIIRHEEALSSCLDKSATRSAKKRSTESGYHSCQASSAANVTSPKRLAEISSDIKRESSSTAVYLIDLKQSDSLLSTFDAERCPSGPNRYDLIAASKTGRRCRSPPLKLLSRDSPHEINVVPQVKKAMIVKIPNLTLDSPYSLDKEDDALLENLDSHKKMVITAPECETHKSAEYSSNNVCFENILLRLENLTASCPSSLSELDSNVNYPPLAHQEPALQKVSPQSKHELTPVNKIPTPLSTSSPMQTKQSLSNANQEMLLSLQDFVSPVRRNPGTAKSKNTKDSSLKTKKQERRSLHLHNRLALGEANNNLITSSDEEQHVVSTCSSDYLLLKKAADVIVNGIPYKKDIKSFINMAILVEYLRFHYKNDISKISSRHVQTISDYKTFKTEFIYTFEPSRLTHGNCLSELRDSFLVNQPKIVKACANFIFENLHFLISCPDFLQMPPEMFLMLLENDSSLILGHNGFPLSHKESEREVHRAVKRYLQEHKTGKSTTYSQTERMFSFFNSKGIFKDNQEIRGINATTLLKRPYYEIDYQKSEECIAAKNTQQEHIFQPYLPPSLSGYFAGASEQSPHLATSTQNGAWNYCSTAHTLRKLFFSYRRHNKVPYITQIGLQYGVRGKKVVHFIGGSPCVQGHSSGRSINSTEHIKIRTIGTLNTLVTPVTSERFNNFSATTSSSPSEAAALEPVTNVEDESTVSQPSEDLIIKKTAIKLACGEHVTGVMVQGTSVVHNVMIRTNKGRHVRAHGSLEVPNGTVWTSIPSPENSKYCLQAVYAESRTDSTGTYIRDVGTIWAVLSVPLNNLNQ